MKRGGDQNVQNNCNVTFELLVNKHYQATSVFDLIKRKPESTKSDQRRVFTKYVPFLTNSSEIDRSVYIRRSEDGEEVKTCMEKLTKLIVDVLDNAVEGNKYWKV